MTSYEGSLDLSVYPNSTTWVDEVIKLDQGKKKSSTPFSSYQVATPMLTNMDLQGERIGLEALKRFVDHVNKSGVPLTVEHDPLIPPVGITFAAKLFQDRSNERTAVIAVAGIYDRNAVLDFKAIGVNVSESAGSYISIPQRQEAAVSLALDTSRFDKTELCNLLSDKPSVVSDGITDDALKALDAPTLIRILVTPFGLFFARFAWKYGDRTADLAADETKQFYEWIKMRVCHFLASRTKGPTRLVFEARHENCVLRMVISSNDEALLQKAVDSLPEAANLAFSIFTQTKNLEPELIVVKFESVSKLWVPGFIISHKIGLISSEAPPIFDNTKYKGVSIGMTLRPGERFKHQGFQ